MPLGKLKTAKPIETAIKDSKEWLSKLGIGGLDMNFNYDAKLNIALIRFKYKGKSYEFISRNQDNARLNAHAIAQVMQGKVRAHIMKIEDFGTAMSPYLQLENRSDFHTQTPVNPQIKASDRDYAVLGMTPLASNPELENRYKSLMKTWHPDNALSGEAKLEFQKRAQEINEVWSNIKKERGIQ